jgi:hypothetical protein
MTTSGKGLNVPKNPAQALRALNAKHAPRPAEDTKNTTILQTDKQTDQPTNQQANKPFNKQTDRPTDAPAPRPDGRTLRPRAETADRTMVTSMRLAVATVDQLDEFCWRHRRRKQDVIQEALERYFAAADDAEQA